jgi:DNA-binding transcriptional regulator YiaG
MTKEEFIQIRKKLGTQPEVAKGIGVELRRLQSWEQGTRPLPAWAPNSIRFLAQKKGEELKAIAKG